MIRLGDPAAQPGAPVTPYVVKGDPALLQIPTLTEMKTAPDEPGGPTQAPPAPSPILDPVIQLSEEGPSADAEVATGIDELSGPQVNIAGTTAPANPPDTVGDVGPDHFVQMNNAGVLPSGAWTGTSYEIWNKDGSAPAGGLGGPFRFGGLWPAGDPCNSDLGDPIVVYDHLADRWLLSQFARNAAQTSFWECIAISQTADPTDNLWYLYTFSGIPSFPDYPKFGVWPDGYYMSSWEAPNLGIYVFDRVNMLNGNAAAYMRDQIPGLGTASVRATRILPADLDGPPPPAGTPNYFARTVDNQQDPGTNDRIEVYEATVDWGAGTFAINLVDTLTPAPFQVMLCDRNGLPAPGPGQPDPRIRDCIPQPDETDTVDALSNRPMMQLKYRNFGTYEAMVFNQTIDVSGSIPTVLDITPAGEVAGIRWYELRKSGANWAIEQQGTFAPQPLGATAEDQLIHRWMGSAAMDKYGNIALGYSVVNSDDTNGQEIYPGIWYTGRTVDDLAGFMAQGEKVILNGVISQGNGDANVDPQRWGDYSAMSVDPVDDCTFWYTTHVAGQGGNGPRPTQIGSFRFNSCGTDMSISKSDNPDPVYAGQLLSYGITVRNNGPNLALGVTVTDTLPSSVTYISDNDSCVEGPVGTLVCDVGDLAVGASASFDILVEVDADLVATAGGVPTLLNTAEVASDRSDPDPSNNVAEATTFVYEMADLQVFKDCKPDIPMPAGTSGTCYITIENLGPSTARVVTLEDVHVSNGTFTIGSVTTSTGVCGVTANPQNGTGTVDCDLGDVDPDQVVTIQVPITADTAQNVNDRATVRSDTTDPIWSNNVANDGLSFIDAADLAISKEASFSTVIAGTQLAYTMTITNYGPSTATNVVVEDVLPVGVAIQTVQASAGSCNAGVPGNAGLPTTCTFDSMAPGASENMQIVVLVDATLLGSLGNNARVASDTYDPNNANNLATVATTVEGAADLQVFKSDVTDPVDAGDPLRYEVLVFNAGPSLAVDVSLRDILPTEVTYVGYDVSGGSGTCVLAAGPPISVDCELGDLLPGQSITVGIDTIVDPSVPNGTVILNQVMVSSATPDPDMSNNTDTEETRVWAEADLAAGKDASFLTENPAPRILYTLTVVNGGPSDAQDVVLVDTLPLDPQKIVYVMDSGNGACLYEETSHTVTCQLGTVAAGETVTIEIIVDARGSVGRITNVADVSSTTADADMSNNHVEKEIRVKGGPGTG
jgi:uncharacterized repeat protein (TIGR01451 family)